MKNILFTLLSFIISIIIVALGLILSFYYLNVEFSFVAFIIGMIGYYIAIRPSIDYWDQSLKKLFKINK